MFLLFANESALGGIALITLATFLTLLCFLLQGKFSKREQQTPPKETKPPESEPKFYILEEDGQKRGKRVRLRRE